MAASEQPVLSIVTGEAITKERDADELLKLTVLAAAGGRSCWSSALALM